MSEGPSREEFASAVDSLRSEFMAGLTTAGVQIGAVEKTLVAKLSSLRAWGVAALVGGQTAAGLLAAYGPTRVAGEAMEVAQTLAHLF